MLAVLDGLNDSTFLQLYLDQFFTPEVGGQVNDQTALLFAGDDLAGGRGGRDHRGRRRLTASLTRVAGDRLDIRRRPELDSHHHAMT